jgi:hypothetical protein
LLSAAFFTDKNPERNGKNWSCGRDERGAAYKIMKELIGMGIFKKRGRGKATYYVLI